MQPASTVLCMELRQAVVHVAELAAQFGHRCRRRCLLCLGLMPLLLRSLVCRLHAGQLCLCL